MSVAEISKKPYQSKAAQVDLTKPSVLHQLRGTVLNCYGFIILYRIVIIKDNA